MARIPLGTQSYNRTDGFQPEVKLVNLFMEQDESGASVNEGETAWMQLQRPGLTLFSTFTGSMVRGMFYQQGIVDSLPVVVVGTDVRTMDGVTNALLGTVEDDGDTVALAATYDKLGIVSVGKFYVYDGATLDEVAIPDSRVAVGLETINGYFVIAIEDGTFFWLAPDETVIDGASYATAENKSDGLVGIKRVADELFLFGTSTTEVWQTTGDLDAPFQRANGRTYDKGCMARDTIHNFDNSVLWLGDEGIVYRASNVPTRISSQGIEERIRKRTDAASAFTFLHDAHLFYVLRIPGQGTFAYDVLTDRWSEFSTYEATTWKPHVAVRTLDGTYAGDSTSGKVWLIDPDANTDDGTAIERLVTATVPFNGKPRRVDNLTLFTGSSEDCDFQVRWYDGRETPGSYTTLRVRAPVDNASIFRLGMTFQPVRTFEVRCIANAKVRISSLLVNEAWNNR